MKKSAKYPLILWGTVCAGTALLCLPTFFPEAFRSLLSFPFSQIRTLLSLLAGTGSLGNGAALALLAGCVLAPAALSLCSARIRSDRLSCGAGIALSAVFAIGSWMLWNPDFIYPAQTGPIKAMIDSAVGAFLWSGIIAFLCILLLRYFRNSDVKRLTEYGADALCVFGGILLASPCASVSEAAAALASSGTGNADGILSLVRAVLSLLPAAVSALAMYTGVKVLLAYGARETDAALLLAQTAEKRCMAALLSDVGFFFVSNLLTLLFSRFLQSTGTSFYLPLAETVAVLAVLLAVRLLRKNKQLSDENNLFV